MRARKKSIMSTDGMWLIIGGTAQGKLNYALGQHPQTPVFDEKSFNELCAEDQVDRVIWNHFHLSVKKMMKKGKSEQQIADIVKEVLDKHPSIVVISDEIGNGVVPVDEMERRYRDFVGRQLIYIAGRAEKVVRILCGIPNRIK